MIDQLNNITMNTPLTNKHYGITSCGPDEIGTDDVEFARDLERKLEQVKKERDRLLTANHSASASYVQAVAQAAAFKADLARVSEELGLPPTIGPAPGWLKEQLDNYKIVLAELTTVKKERDEALKQTKGITPDELGKMVWESMDQQNRRIDEPANKHPCACSTCLDKAGVDVWWMVVCKKCGNKRCPHAKDHNNECTKSNAPGQKGSSYE